MSFRLAAQTGIFHLQLIALPLQFGLEGVLHDQLLGEGSGFGYELSLSFLFLSALAGELSQPLFGLAILGQVGLQLPLLVGGCQPDILQVRAPTD